MRQSTPVAGSCNGPGAWALTPTSAGHNVPVAEGAEMGMDPSDG